MENNSTYVIDALPGTGKTFAMFNIMRNNPQEKWLYLSPLLSEVEERIQQDIPELNFKTPESKATSKTKDVLKLLEDGENISCTHSLFELMDSRHWEVFHEQGYNLVSDEEVGAIKNFPCKSRDVEIMVEDGNAEVLEPYGKVLLKKPLSYFVGSSVEKIAKEASNGSLYRSKIRNGGTGYLVSQIPIELFLSAKQTYILTYMFEGSLLERFLAVYGVDWDYKEVELRKSNSEVIASLRDNINFKTLPAIDALSKFTLSYSWYEKARLDQLQMVGNAFRAVLRQAGNDEGRVIVTLPKLNAEKEGRYVGRKKDKPVINCYLSPRTRATNAYAHKDVVLHMYNRSPNVSVIGYFDSYGLTVDRDHFALSEMIQFIFRSAVRNGKPIDLYLASARMQKLLNDWLNQQEEQLLD